MRSSQLPSLLAVLAAAAPSLAANSFGYSGSDFLLNGDVYQIIGGQMDPQRVPYELWDDRLAMARAMGLNTILSYLYWDQLEPSQGKWAMDENNNITGWLETAQENGLHVVLRPGPYICGEHEWGGFPAWLSTINNMTVRSNNPQFLDATTSYLQHLGSSLQPYFASQGGPVLMAQVENEYGFYSDDHSYTQALADILKDAFPTVTLYTNDGSSQGALAAGSIPGILAETDGGIDGFAGRDAWIDPSSVGPYLDGEYYITWLDQWGPSNAHNDDSGNTAKIQSIQSDFETVLKNGTSISMYMFHGGTNWGFQNGADFGDAYEPVTTSYDYGAPLDESGRPNDIYTAVRETIMKYVDGVPDVPSKPAMVGTSPITMTPYIDIFDTLPPATTSQSPINMEQLGQSTGFILYRYKSAQSISGTLKLGDGPRDRALIYVNGARVGVIDATYQTPQVVNLTLAAHDQLDILIENLGRINFGNLIPDQRKGIVGDVSIGRTVIQGFNHYTLPCDKPYPIPSQPSKITISTTQSPLWYSGTFDMGSDTPSDTYLELPGWVKGVVYVNGYNLGRYWTIGPQQSLYVPGVYLKRSGNVVNVLNLEPTGKESPVQGVATRSWGNNPDPDAP
jgi:beta-galactosidase GanA